MPLSHPRVVAESHTNIHLYRPISIFYCPVWAITGSPVACGVFTIM